MSYSVLGLNLHSQQSRVHVGSPTPSQVEIDRQIAKLKEDSEKDVKRQLKEQRVATEEERIEEDIGSAVERVLSPAGEAKVAPALSVAEHVLATVANDAEAGMQDVRKDVHVLEMRLEGCGAGSKAGTL